MCGCSDARVNYGMKDVESIGKTPRTDPRMVDKWRYHIVLYYIMSD